MDFYTGLLSGTVIAVIFLLAIMGYLMYTFKGKQTYPPSIANCPDFYSLDISGNCKASSALDVSGSCLSQNFSIDPYIATGTNFLSGNCQKKLWAQKCHVGWDGITNDGDLCFN